MKKMLIAIAVVLAGSALLAVDMGSGVFIPAAARAAGGSGSFWRTDLTLTNPDAAFDLYVTVELIPSGVAGSAQSRLCAELPAPIGPGQTLTVADVLGTYFPEQSVGALVLVGRDQSGVPMPVLATSRTWTPSSGAAGTYGQGIPAVAMDNTVGEGRKGIILGLETSAAFRTNVGFVNTSMNLRETLGVTIVDASGAAQGTLTYTLEPWAHLQRSNILSELSLTGSGYAAVVQITGTEEMDLYPGASHEPAFIAYGSRVDAVTNDPVYLQAFSPDDTQDSGSAVFIPAAAKTSGGGGSFWQTDVAVYNPVASDLYLTLEFIPSGYDGSAASRHTVDLEDPIHAGQTLQITDVLGTYFPGGAVGALILHGRDLNGVPAALTASSRTWTPEPAPANPDHPGTFGQGIPGIPETSSLNCTLPGAYHCRQVIQGLESSGAFRSNLGIVNTSLQNQTTFAVDILDSNGALKGTLNYTLGPWAHIQRSNILSELGLSGSGYQAVVRAAQTKNGKDDALEAAFIAYASRVDWTTNDPVYLESARAFDYPKGTPVQWYNFDGAAPWYQCPADSFPSEATVVTAFSKAFQYFGSENQREVVGEVQFPSSMEWSQVGMMVKLECPAGGKCDYWDRTASVQMILNPGSAQSEWKYLELMRHITPYRMGMCEYVDVTPLASLLTGRRALSTWIDTWVGPGSSSGDGWVVTVKFVFYPGPKASADHVMNVWGMRFITMGYTDPPKDVESQIQPVTLNVPANAVQVTAREITTGHGFGFTDNCAEFCHLRQDLYTNDVRASVDPWRNNCGQNPVSPQSGTWQYNRNGWCPGSIVVGHAMDVTPQILFGSDNVFNFDIRNLDGSEYINTVTTGSPWETISLQLYVYR